MNLAEIEDKTSLADQNAEAAIGVITMKYAFDAPKYKAKLPKIEKKLKPLSKEDASTLVEKIELYLGEYIDEVSLRRLKMEFQSIGQRLGFVSAGDERRAMEKENRTLKAQRKAGKAKIASLTAENAALKARNAELEAKLAAK